MKAQTTLDAATQPAPITTQIIEFYLMSLAAARTPEEAKQKTADTFRAVNSNSNSIAALEVIEGSLHSLLVERVLDSTRQEFYTVRHARDTARHALALARGNQ